MAMAMFGAPFFVVFIVIMMYKMFHRAVKSNISNNFYVFLFYWQKKSKLSLHSLVSLFSIALTFTSRRSLLSLLSGVGERHLHDN